MDLRAASPRVCGQQSRLHMLPTSARHFQQAFGSVQQTVGLVHEYLSLSFWLAPSRLSPAPSTCLSANFPWLLHGYIGTSLCAPGEGTFGGTMARRGSAQYGVCGCYGARDTCWLHYIAVSALYTTVLRTEYSKRLSVPTCQAEWPVSSHPHDSAHLAPNPPTCLPDDDLAVSAGHLSSGGFRSAPAIPANQSMQGNTRLTKEEGRAGFGHGPVRDFLHYLDALGHLQLPQCCNQPSRQPPVRMFPLLRPHQILGCNCGAGLLGSWATPPL